MATRMDSSHKADQCGTFNTENAEKCGGPQRKPFSMKDLILLGFL